MELTLNFGELGNFTFKTVEELEYVASFLGWIKYKEVTTQVYLDPVELKDEEGNTLFEEDGITPRTMIPTYPETKQVENEIDARAYLIGTAKKMLMDIPARAFLKRIEQEAEAMKQAQLEAIKSQIAQQTQ